MSDTICSMCDKKLVSWDDLSDIVAERDALAAIVQDLLTNFEGTVINAQCLCDQCKSIARARVWSEGQQQ